MVQGTDVPLTSFININSRPVRQTEGLTEPPSRDLILQLDIEDGQIWTGVIEAFQGLVNEKQEGILGSSLDKLKHLDKLKAELLDNMKRADTPTDSR